MVRTDARCAAATMELRLKIEEGSDMFYTRADAKNRGMGAIHTVDVAGKVGRDDSVDMLKPRGILLKDDSSVFRV